MLFVEKYIIIEQSGINEVQPTMTIKMQNKMLHSFQ